jgi:hypothetical protein
LDFRPGRKISVNYPNIGDKKPSIEIYDRLLYFAVTGWRLDGKDSIKACQGKLDELCNTYLRSASSTAAGCSIP